MSAGKKKRRDMPVFLKSQFINASNEHRYASVFNDEYERFLKV